MSTAKPPRAVRHGRRPVYKAPGPATLAAPKWARFFCGDAFSYGRAVAPGADTSQANANRAPIWDAVFLGFSAGEKGGSAVPPFVII